MPAVLQTVAEVAALLGVEGASHAGTTLTQYVLSAVRTRMRSLGPHLEPSQSNEESIEDLMTLLNSITLAVKSVGVNVRCAGLPGCVGAASAGDAKRTAHALNEKANEIWLEALSYSQKSCVIVSEEADEPIVIEKDVQGKFAVVFDPLTGLSDPPAQDMGAIFGVFQQIEGEKPSIADVMQPARNLITAGYALYGASTVLMFSIGDGVHMFTLDASLNEFIMTKSDVRVPFYGSLYSINEGYSSEYDRETQEMLKCLKTEPTLNGQSRSCRYVGSMVADIHRTIIKGGVFMYPPHKRGYPNGRLKLLYEAGPMAFLVTQAGGQASTGIRPIVDICPKDIHTRVPVFLGSPDDVSLATGFYDRTSPWGSKTRDPMYQLRRTHSIEEKVRPNRRNSSIEDEDDDIICFYLG